MELTDRTAQVSHFRLWLKHRIATSPLAGPVGRLRRILARARLLRHPEFGPRHAEAGDIDFVLDRLISDGDSCIDAGAHIGSFAHELRRRAPGGRLVLIEALPKKAAWLARRFPECEVLAVALSDRAGAAPFYEVPGASGMSSLTGRPGAVRHEAQTRRLDDLIGHHVDFMKLDLEGHELEALTGAARIIADDQPVILFEAGPLTGEAEPRSAMLYGLLRDAGYEIYAPVDIRHRRPPLTLAEFDRCRRFPAVSRNFFAIPPQRAGEIIS